MYRKPVGIKQQSSRSQRSKIDLSVKETTSIDVLPQDLSHYRTAIQTELIPWFRTFARAMPWRKNRTPYRVWISEIMLQQTRVSTVIPFFERWMQRFPDVEKLANAELEEVLKTWEGLGYYSRARMIHQTARQIVTEYQGVFPQDENDLKHLAGIGDYTAAAIVAFAYRKPAIAVDGNIARVVSRWLMVPVSYTDRNAPASYRMILQSLLDPESTPDAVEALMELGATVCLPGVPNCEQCPLMGTCKAHENKKVDEFPPPRRKVDAPLIDIAIGILVEQDRILMGLRKKDGFLGGLWELPGGKLEADETPELAVVREYREETGLDVIVEKGLKPIRHAFTHFRIRLHPFVVKTAGGTLTPHSAEKISWIDRNKIKQIPLPKATKLVLRDYGWLE